MLGRHYHSNEFSGVERASRFELMGGRDASCTWHGFLPGGELMAAAILLEPDSALRYGLTVPVSL